MKTTPETTTQAASWQRVVRFAAEAGLCHRCASQLAWGVQNGFATVKPPCAPCAEVMRHWPTARLNGFRTPSGALSRPEAWVSLGCTLTSRTAPAARQLRRAASVDEQLREGEG